jgi:hypothetical protein
MGCILRSEVVEEEREETHLVPSERERERERERVEPHKNKTKQNTNRSSHKAHNRPVPPKSTPKNPQIKNLNSIRSFDSPTKIGEEKSN